MVPLDQFWKFVPNMLKSNLENFPCMGKTLGTCAPYESNLSPGNGIYRIIARRFLSHRRMCRFLFDHKESYKRDFILISLLSDHCPICLSDHELCSSTVVYCLRIMQTYAKIFKCEYASLFNFLFHIISKLFAVKTSAAAFFTQ